MTGFLHLRRAIVAYFDQLARRSRWKGGHLEIGCLARWDRAVTEEWDIVIAWADDEGGPNADAMVIDAARAGYRWAQDGAAAVLRSADLNDSDPLASIASIASGAKWDPTFLRSITSALDGTWTREGGQ